MLVTQTFITIFVAAATGDTVGHADGSGMSAGLVLTVVGMGVVLASLTLLLYLVKLLNITLAERASLVEATRSGTASTAASPNTELEAATASDPGVTPELIAVLTAAATTAIGMPVRIQSVRRYYRPAGEVWRQQGIRNLTTGHRPRGYAGFRRT